MSLRSFYSRVKFHVGKRDFFKTSILHIKFELSKIYRPILSKLGNTCFIAVTGSVGKTTVTDITAAILSKKWHVRKSNQFFNRAEDLGKTIMGVMPWHHFCVNETSGHRKGVMEKAVKLYRPKIGVITHIGQDHHSSFRSLEATATEKGKLAESLPADGTAVLNADDPHVYAMRERTKAKVITYGLSDNAMVRGENVSCSWPVPMSLDVSYGGEKIHLQTQLLGTHWAYSVLAGLATAIACGMPLETAAKAVEAFEPVLGRMSPYISPNGVTFIRDDWKASMWTVPASIDFLRTAKAKRKIAVIGTISDTSKSFSRRYRSIALHASEIVDKIIFTGRHAESAFKTRAYRENEKIMTFETLYQANSFLRDYLKEGDLVLLKGSTLADHLQRIVLSQTNDIACWKQGCKRLCFCTDCKLQYNACVPDHIELSKHN
jgi:UDP-N-acetylmuramoyl-tripeptide--D-alanyl-D-alanine ligase